MADAVKRIQVILNKLVSIDMKAKSSKGFQHVRSRRVSCGSEHAFRLPIGMDYKKLSRSVGALSANLGTPVELENHYGVVVVRVVEQDFPAEVKFNAADIKEDALLIGYNRSLEPVYHPLNVHLLAAGAAGAGKTDFLRWLLYQFLIQKYQIKIVDMKGFSFYPFEPFTAVEVSADLLSAAQMLGEAFAEMVRRENLVKKHRNRNIIKEFRPMVVIIDEAAQIAPDQTTNKEAKEIAKYCDEMCAKIAQKGREPKVFLVYCTQRPDRHVINPQVKANVEAAVAFRTKTISNSMIILDRPGAEQISPSTPGRCIYSGRTDHLLQVPYIGGDDEWINLLSEMLQHEQSPRKDIEISKLRTFGIHASIGGTQSIAESPKESVKAVQGVGAKWAPNGHVARQRAHLEIIEKRPAEDRRYTDEIEEP